jgi:lipoyl(octanoyl) transferase
MPSLKAMRRKPFGWLSTPRLYTAGTSANREDLIDANRFPVFSSKRGGNIHIMGRANGLSM